MRETFARHNHGAEPAGDARLAGSKATSATAIQLEYAISHAMDELIGLFCRERHLVAKGALDEAFSLGDAKVERIAAFARLLEKLKAMRAHQWPQKAGPGPGQALAEKYQLFQAEAQKNLKVLAIARSLAERLVSSASQAARPASQAKLYGAGGQFANAAKSTGGFALNRRV